MKLAFLFLTVIIYFAAWIAIVNESSIIGIGIMWMFIAHDWNKSIKKSMRSEDGRKQKP